MHRGCSDLSPLGSRLNDDTETPGAAVARDRRNRKPRRTGAQCHRTGRLIAEFVEFVVFVVLFIVVEIQAASLVLQLDAAPVLRPPQTQIRQAAD